jgi:hypothetical protein
MFFQTRCPQCKKAVSAKMVYADKLSLFLNNEGDVLVRYTPDAEDRTDHRWLLTVQGIGNLRKARARLLMRPLASSRFPTS